MLVTLISFLFGIFWGLYIKNSLFFLCFLVILGVILYIKDKKRLFFIFALISSIALLYINQYETKFEAIQEEFQIKGNFFIASLKKEGEYKDYYIAKDNINRKVKLYVSKNIKTLEYGDYVYVEGNFTKAETSRNEYEFDYRQYLKQNKIYGMVFVDKFEIKNIEKATIRIKAMKIILELKNNAEKFLDKKYTNETSNFLKALLFGNTSNLDEEIKEQFRKSNLSHIIAISGMHISYLVVIIKKFTKVFKLNKKIENCISSLILSIFIVLIDFPVSAVRAVFMQIIWLLVFCINRKSDFYNNFCLSMFLILAINPYNIESVAMWLSFGGVLGIFLFYKFFRKLLLTRKLKKFFSRNKLYMKILELFVEGFCLNIAVQIIIFPIIWFNFNFISISSFISNIVTSPFVAPIILLGYFSFIETFIPFNIITSINSTLLRILFYLVEKLSKLPLSVIYIKKPSIFFIIFYYLLIFFIIYKVRKNTIINFLHIWRIKSGKRSLEKYFNIRKLAENKVLIILIIFVFLFQYIQKNFNREKYIEIYFLDVRQGDCTVIKTPNNKFIVIDTGEGGKNSSYDYGRSSLLPFLINKGARKIDFLIISHFDSDHCGGALSIMEEIRVDKIFVSKQKENSENFESFIELAKENNASINFIKTGDKINFSRNLYMEILWPKETLEISENPLNNNSIVGKLIYKNFSILFTGDIEEIAEKAILDKYENNSHILKSTILKVAHHGSKTSSIIEFLNKVKPQYALIGVGKNNKFGHPSSSTLNNLEKLKIKIYRTDISGQIYIKTDGNKIDINEFLDKKQN